MAQTEPAPESPTLGRVVARFAPAAQRDRLSAAAREQRLRRVGEVDLLQAEKLPALAQASLLLFVAGAAGFLALQLVARDVQHSGPLLGTAPLVARLITLVAVNLVAYALMIVVHELIHAAVILALGGAPRFGLKLPLAAYCTAPGQLFTARGYALIALAPLVVLTLAGVVVTWLSPDAGALLWLAFVGNVSGAAGDLEAVSQLRQMSDAQLIADTATGFTAYAESTASAHP